MPASVTTSGRRTPRFLSSSGSRPTEPAPKTIVVGKENVERFMVASHRFEIARQLPVRNRFLELAYLPLTGRRVVIHEVVAQPAARHFALAKQFRGGGEGARQGSGVARISVDHGRRRVQFALDAVESGSEGSGHGEVWI